MTTRFLIAIVASACALHASRPHAQSQGADNFIPNQPPKAGADAQASESHAVKYVLLLPDEKSSETVKDAERNPFGKSDDGLHDIGGKSSNEETKIQEQLSKLRATGLSPGPNGLRVLFGDMWLSKNDVMPPVVKDQTLALRVNEISREAIQLVWLEKKFTGLPPRLLVIPVDLRATVRRVPHGQLPEKVEAKTESKASKRATAVELPAPIAANTDPAEARESARNGAGSRKRARSRSPRDQGFRHHRLSARQASPSSGVLPPHRLKQTPSPAPNRRLTCPGCGTSATQPATAAPPVPQIARGSTARPFRTTVAGPRPHPPRKRAKGLMENLIKPWPPISPRIPPAAPDSPVPAATEPAAWKRAMGLMDKLVKLSEAGKMTRRFMAAGFTAAEMLVASAVAGIVAGTAALTIYTVTLAQRQYNQIATFTLPNGALANFYPGQSGTSVNCVVAPNFSAVAQAESVREKFILDTSQAVGVYCLARNSGNYNTIRPTGITSPPAGTNLDTPDAFRTYLGTLYSAAPTTFVSYRNFPATAPCLSIYILGYSNNAASIPVTAVYDLDVVSAKEPPQRRHRRQLCRRAPLRERRAHRLL